MRRPSALGAALGVMLVGLASASGAAAFGGQSTIQACVKSQGGQLRIVGSGEACRTNEYALSWDEQGLPGPPGPAFLSVTLREREFQITLAAGEETSRGVACRVGEVVLSGLVSSGPPAPGVAFDNGGLFFDGTHSGWMVGFKNNGPGPVSGTWTVGATCTPGAMTQAFEP